MDARRDRLPVSRGGATIGSVGSELAPGPGPLRRSIRRVGTLRSCSDDLGRGRARGPSTDAIEFTEPSLAFERTDGGPDRPRTPGEAVPTSRVGDTRCKNRHRVAGLSRARAALPVANHDPLRRARGAILTHRRLNGAWMFARRWGATAFTSHKPTVSGRWRGRARRVGIGHRGWHVATKRRRRRAYQAAGLSSRR